MVTKVNSLQDIGELDLFKIDISDIPKECRRELKNIKPERKVREKKERKSSTIEDLFHFKQRLTIDEVIIALYRLGEGIKKRQYIYGHMYYLIKLNIIRKVEGEQGTFELIKKSEK